MSGLNPQQRMVAVADMIDHVLEIAGAQFEFEDETEAAMCVVYCATRRLYRFSKAIDPDLVMIAAKIMADSCIKSTADMISGSDAHQVPQ